MLRRRFPSGLSKFSSALPELFLVAALVNRNDVRRSLHHATHVGEAGAREEDAAADLYAAQEREGPGGRAGLRAARDRRLAHTRIGRDLANRYPLRRGW